MCELFAGGVVGDVTAIELLALLDDLAHPRLDLLEVLGHERHLDVEVVVEAVGDRRTDAEPGVGEDFLHGLGHDMRGRVAQDVAAVLGIDLDSFDDITVGKLVRKVLQLGADPRRDDRRLVGEQLPGLGACLH